MILLKEMIHLAAQEIHDAFPWPELEKEYTFTLATSTPAYALPGDLDRLQMETLWNRSQFWPIIGPLDAIQWQHYKSGAISSFPHQRYRVKTWQTKQFFIDPTPTSSENGQTVAFEYITSNNFRPKTWVASTSWTGMQYCSYNGNIYDRGGTGAGSTGTTAPTHTTSTPTSDGSLTWTYLTDSVFDSINHDNDETILDQSMIIDGAVWRFKRERGYFYETFEQAEKDSIDIEKSKLAGSGIISARLRDSGYSIAIGVKNYPVSDF